MSGRETRNTSSKVEVRADGEKRKIIGYGAVFYDGSRGTEYWLWDDMVERIMPGAFDRALREDDVRGLFNHDSNMVLGRTSAGTMRLSSDATGLRYEIDPGDTQVGRDVLQHVSRGDVSGSSFSFIPTKTTWRENDDILVREIEEVKLYDVGPVTFPAYEGTTADSRSRRGVSEERRAALLEERSAFIERTKLVPQVSGAEMDARIADMRLKELGIG